MGNYIKETQAEIKHVSWPTRRQAISYTIIVIVISILVGIYLGFLDAGFTAILKQII